MGTMPEVTRGGGGGLLKKNPLCKCKFKYLSWNSRKSLKRPCDQWHNLPPVNYLAWTRIFKFVRWNLNQLVERQARDPEVRGSNSNFSLGIRYCNFHKPQIISLFSLTGSNLVWISSNKFEKANLVRLLVNRRHLVSQSTRPW